MSSNISESGCKKNLYLWESLRIGKSLFQLHDEDVPEILAETKEEAIQLFMDQIYKETEALIDLEQQLNAARSLFHYRYLAQLPGLPLTSNLKQRLNQYQDWEKTVKSIITAEEPLVIPSD